MSKGKLVFNNGVSVNLSDETVNNLLSQLNVTLPTSIHKFRCNRTGAGKTVKYLIGSVYGENCRWTGTNPDSSGDCLIANYTKPQVKEIIKALQDMLKPDKK